MEILKKLEQSVKDVAVAIGKIVVLGLSMLTGWVSARGSGVRRRRMRVVESLALGDRRQLLLVECDEQEYLVGAGAESVTTIVPRQPSTRLPGGVSEAATAQEVPMPANVAIKRAGTALREKAEGGPWLVTPGGRVDAENRIREDDSGKVLELWQ